MDIEKLIERLWNYKELEQVKRIPQKRQKKRPCMKMTPFMRKRNVNP